MKRPEFVRRTVRWIASRWPFPVEAQLLDGRRLYVDLRSSIGRAIYVKGTFDPAVGLALLPHIRPSSTFLDVGANIGFYSILALNKLTPHGLVYCFEIDERPLRVLRRTLQSRNIANLHVVRSAVHEQSGTMYFEPRSESGHNYVRRSPGGVAVPAIRLDDWIQSNRVSDISAIKIDVEGAELSVIRGARELLRKHRPVVVAECSEENLNRFGVTVADLQRQMERWNYSSEKVTGAWTPTLLFTPSQ